MLYLKAIDKCRVCSCRHLSHVLSLGDQYVTNFIADPKQKAYKGPLELVICDKKKGGCGLLQLRHTFDHDILYKKYWYRSGTSTTMVKALNDIVTSAEKLLNLKSNDIVVDIGANDGTLLKQYKEKGLVKVGFEPSNLWSAGSGRDLKMIHGYFNYTGFSKNFGNRKAKIITSIAMFYDLDDPNKFVEDVRKCLDKNGVWIIQMNYLGLMVENNTFDNISHEHLEYYSLLSLEYLLDKHGFEVFDVELNDVNGGSFRIYIKHKGAKIKAFLGAASRLRKQRNYEKRQGFERIAVYKKFAKRIQDTRYDIFNLLKREVHKGKKIFIYGASTRGLVVLQFAGIDDRLIAAATDKSPDKWGRYIVGTNIKIMSIEQYRKEKPDYLFVLPYHFIKEISHQEAAFLKRGGRMIIAIPKLRIIKKPL